MKRISGQQYSLLFVLLMLPWLTFGSSMAAAQGSQTTLPDLAGREVSLKVPVCSIVLAGWSGSGNPFFTLFGLLGDKTPKMILGMDEGLKNNRQWIWQKFVEKYPDLESIPDVGSPPEINIEKIISLAPDVVMVPTTAAKSSMDAFKKLEQAGIPVVMNDYHTESFATHIKSIELIGTIVGQPERAREMIDFYKKQCSRVEDRLARSSAVRPKVYVELGTNPEEYGNTYGNSMWGVLISRAGGSNIAQNLIDSYGPISPEAVLQANPQIIVLTGANWPKRPKSLKLGYYVEKEESKDTLENFLARPGWATLDGVKNRRIFGIHHGLSREVWDFYPIQCFAKWFYPDMFSDLDPDANLREFHSKFLGLDLSGTWAVALD